MENNYYFNPEYGRGQPAPSAPGYGTRYIGTTRNEAREDQRLRNEAREDQRRAAMLPAREVVQRLTHEIHVESSDRNKTDHPAANHYRMKLPHNMKNVTKVELLSAEVPNTQFSIDASNNKLDFSVNNMPIPEYIVATGGNIERMRTEFPERWDNAKGFLYAEDSDGKRQWRKHTETVEGEALYVGNVTDPQGTHIVSADQYRYQEKCAKKASGRPLYSDDDTDPQKHPVYSDIEYDIPGQLPGSLSFPNYGWSPIMTAVIAPGWYSAETLGPAIQSAMEEAVNAVMYPESIWRSGKKISVSVDGATGKTTFFRQDSLNASFVFPDSAFWHRYEYVWQDFQTVVRPTTNADLRWSVAGNDGILIDGSGSAVRTAAGNEVVFTDSLYFDNGAVSIGGERLIGWEAIPNNLATTHLVTLDGQVQTETLSQYIADSTNHLLDLQRDRAKEDLYHETNNKYGKPILPATIGKYQLMSDISGVRKPGEAEAALLKSVTITSNGVSDTYTLGNHEWLAEDDQKALFPSDQTTKCFVVDNSGTFHYATIQDFTVQKDNGSVTSVTAKIATSSDHSIVDSDKLAMFLLESQIPKFAHARHLKFLDEPDGFATAYNDDNSLDWKTATPPTESSITWQNHADIYYDAAGRNTKEISPATYRYQNLLPTSAKLFEESVMYRFRLHFGTGPCNRSTTNSGNMETIQETIGFDTGRPLVRQGLQIKEWEVVIPDGRKDVDIGETYTKYKDHYRTFAVTKGDVRSEYGDTGKEEVISVGITTQKGHLAQSSRVIAKMRNLITSDYPCNLLGDPYAFLHVDLDNSGAMPLRAIKSAVGDFDEGEANPDNSSEGAFGKFQWTSLPGSVTHFSTNSEYPMSKEFSYGTRPSVKTLEITWRRKGGNKLPPSYKHRHPLGFPLYDFNGFDHSLLLRVTEEVAADSRY